MKTLIRRTIHHWQHWLYKRRQAKLCARLVKQHPILRHFDTGRVRYQAGQEGFHYGFAGWEDGRV